MEIKSVESQKKRRKMVQIPKRWFSERIEYTFALKSDIELFVALNQNPITQQYNRNGKIVSRAWCESYFKGCLGNKLNDKIQENTCSVLFVLKLRKTQEKCGVIEISFKHQPTKNIAMGRLFLPQFTSKGLGTEAAIFITQKLLKPYVMQNGINGFTHIYATTSVENIAANKSLQKSGFINPDFIGIDYSPQTGRILTENGFQNIYWLSLR